jgi:hypothetical protein
MEDFANNIFKNKAMLYNDKVKEIVINLNQFNTFSWINEPDEIVLTINLEGKNFSSELFIGNMVYPKIRKLNLIDGKEIKLLNSFPGELFVNWIRLVNISSNIVFDGIAPNFEISQFRKNVMLDFKDTNYLKNFVINGCKGIQIVNMPSKLDGLYISGYKFDNLFFSRIIDLKYLRLFFSQGQFNLEYLKSFPSFESFSGYWARATNVWPNSQALSGLRFVSFESLSGLSDLKGLAKAPNLKYLLAITRHIKGTEFEIFKDHPTLEFISLWPKSHKEELLFEKWFGNKFVKSGFESFLYNSDKRELNLS